MTAVDVDALDKLRDELRGNLWAHQAEPWDDGPVARQRSEEELAEILLPVVDRIANKRAAAELHKAADDWRDRDQNTDLWLRARAYALDPS